MPLITHGQRLFRAIVAILLAFNDRSIKLLKSCKSSESGRRCEAAIIENELVYHLSMSLRAHDEKIT